MSLKKKNKINRIKTFIKKKKKIRKIEKKEKNLTFNINFIFFSYPFFF